MRHEHETLTETSCKNHEFGRPDVIHNTHRAQQTLGFLDGAVTAEEAHQHHQSSHGDQYVNA